jgi:hypothetical protein
VASVIGFLKIFPKVVRTYLKGNSVCGATKICWAAAGIGVFIGLARYWCEAARFRANPHINCAEQYLFKTSAIFY